MAALTAILYILTFLRALSLYHPLLDSCNMIHNIALKGLSFTNSLFFDKNPTGRMLNRFGTDIASMDGFLVINTVDTFILMILLIGNYVAAMIISPYITIVFILALVYFILNGRYFSVASRKLKRFEQITKSPILTLINSSIHGLVTIRSQNIKKKMKRDLRKAIELNYKAYIAQRLLIRTIQEYFDFGPLLLSIINIIILVLLRDSLPPGLAGMSISLTSVVIGFSGFLFKMMLDTDNYMTSVQRLIEYQKLPCEGIFKTKESFQITKGLVQIKDLYMKYREEYDYALKNLNITFQAGMKTGVVGRTGAGKSSLMHVLFRLTNPSRGTLFIDGKDYLQISLHDLRKQISVIPQSSTLFSTSLRNNLDPFHEHSDQEIIEVLINTQLESIFNDSKSPDLNIEIHSDKVQLSEGQKQLMCLARAILRKNKIVMIDEATANVDNETDKCIQSHLEERFKESTVITIAHRLRTIVDSDWVIVMEGGMCIEEGNPKELIKQKKSKFLKMIKHTGPEESEYLKSRLSS